MPVPWPRALVLILLAAAVTTGPLPAAEPPPEPSARPGQPPPGATQDEVECARLLQETQRLRAEGKLPQAVAALQKALPLLRRLVGSTHEAVAVTLGALAEMQEQQGDFAGARQGRREVLDIRTRTDGPRHWRTGDARRALAQTDLLERFTPAQRAEVARAEQLNSLVLRLIRQGKFAEAEGPARRALRIRKAVLGEKHPVCGQSLNNLAMLYKEMGDHAQAEPLYQQALSIRKVVLGEKHPVYALSLNNLAQLYCSMGAYARAEPLFKQALAINKETLGNKHSDYAATLNNLALVYQSVGSYAQAEPLLKEALAIHKEVLGEKHPDYAQSLHNLAHLYRSMGSYARAESLFKQALAIKKEALGQKHPDYALSLNNLAALYREMGDYGRAEPLYQQALAIYKQALGEKHPDYATSLNNLAMVYWSMGAYAQAEPAFKQALAIRKDVLGEKHPDYAQSLHNLAGLYWSMGAYARAEPLYRQALAINKEVLGERHPGYPLSLNNLAELYQAMGANGRAEPLFKQALAIQKEALGEKHPHYALTLNNLALLYVCMGQAERARPLLEEAVVILRQLADATAPVQTESQQLAMTLRQRGFLDNYLATGSVGGADAAAAYTEVLAWKGAVASRQRLLRALRQAGRDHNPQVAALVDDLAAATRRLAALSGAGGQAGGKPGELSRLAEDVERLQRALADASPEFAEQWRRRHVSPDDLRKALPAGTALVDLLEYDHYSAPPGHKGPGTWQLRLAAFVVRADRPPVRLDLGPAQPIAAAMDAWRRSYGRGAPAGGADPGAELRRRVWEHLLPALAGARTVLVSPDGALNRLPWAALPGREPGTYLLEEAAIAVLPVPQLLPELQAAGTARADANDGRASVLVVGNVDYGQAPPQASAAGQRPGPSGRISAGYGPLPGTLGEALVVREHFESHFPQGEARALKGAAATKEAVCRGLSSHRWAHLATHGYFADESVRSALAADTRQEATRPGLGRDGSGPAGPVGVPPGLLSGLVLAGANRDSGAGILTALEVAELDLHGLDTAVLSACNSGRGKEAGGEGVLGLQRAFQTAGARTVVASLWPVPDRETRDLMEAFYQNLWEKKLPKLEALRQAQLTMLKSGPRRWLEPEKDPTAKPPARTPPFYWAAFVLSGDWR